MATILIIDDSPTEAEVVSRMLETEGFKVLWAQTADKGIALAKHHSPDLVLMDVVMPGMSGFQATRKLTRDPETKKIPVIILTTKDQMSDRAWGLRNGAKDYLVKPPSKDELISVIRGFL